MSRIRFCYAGCMVLMFQGGLTYADTPLWEIAPAIEHYSSAARKDGSSDGLDTAGIKVQRFVGKNLYLSGQLHAAVAGHAGGYSAGLVGVGIQSPSSDIGLSVGGELLVGAARGGNVDGAGTLFQPMVYAGLDLNRDWRMKLGLGRVKSTNSALNTGVVDVSLSYAFGR